MARIRIVDEWLRSPVSAPARQRAILVVARSWAEQRVLMRAFASCSDQTRPTIILHGEELAIGPASTDPHGEWGIHVQPPVDGRAQQLREALQLAARLLAGSKGNPPRLEDEVPDVEDRSTNNWDPNASRNPEPDMGKRTVFGHDGTESAAPAPPAPEYYEPAINAPTSSSAEILSSGASRAKVAKVAKANMRKTPPFWADVYERPELEEGATPMHMKPAPPAALSVTSQKEAAAQPTSSRRKRQTAQYNGVKANPAQTAVIRKPKKKPAKTVFGFLPEEAPKESFAQTASKTMPIGLTLDESERLVLNELGKHPFVTANAIGHLLRATEPMEWMSRFMDKLAEFGLDLVSPGTDQDGEPTYKLIR